MELEQRILLAVEGLSKLYGNRFAKKQNITKSNREKFYKGLVNSIALLFNDYMYTPISRLQDLIYYTQILDTIRGKIYENNNDPLKKLLEWSNNARLKIDNDPFDIIRLILDSSVEACIGATYMYYRKPSEYSNILKRKIGLLTFEGYCDMLRGIADLTATQFHHEYLFHLGKVIEDLYAYNRRKELSLQQILKLDKIELEKFRVFVTSKFEPTSKAFLLQVILTKIHWPLKLLLESKEIKGIAARKPIEPTYIGRITSEILDAMMYRYYDDTIVQGYDIILKSYFDVLKEAATYIRRKMSVGYLERIPSMRIMEDNINQTIYNILSNIAAQYFKRRGILRLGEVKQDVKDYIMQLYYLYDETRNLGIDIQLSNITSYDLIKLVTKNVLETIQ